MGVNNNRNSLNRPGNLLRIIGVSNYRTSNYGDLTLPTTLFFETRSVFSTYFRTLSRVFWSHMAT